MREFACVLLLTGVIGCAFDGTARESGVVVGDIDLPLKWGNQKAVFDVANQTEDLKFISADIEVQFSDSYLTPNRRTVSHFVLLPQSKESVSPDVLIPGNYGRARVDITLYDVVDTLDSVLPGQKFFEQRFSVAFQRPDEILPYLQEKINMPPRVGDHPDFDSEFSRVFLVLLDEGKSLAEIADMTGGDLAFVQSVFEGMAQKKYVREAVDTGLVVEFPVILVDEAEETKLLVERTSDSLAQIVQSNLPAYWNTVDSLAKAGAIPSNSNSFMDGGTVLYYPYPVVSALLLWFDLGQKFITRSAPLLIWDGTDVCNAYIPYYMYAVQGGDVFNGINFYALFQGKRNLTILYGDSLPPIQCEGDYILKKKLRRRIHWEYLKGFEQESFMLDTALVRPALKALAGDADSLLWSTYLELKALAKRHGHAEAAYGARYWFWNQVATRTLRKLIAEGVLERRGSGQFKFLGV